MGRAKANGIIRCRFSGESDCQPCVANVAFTPDQQIKHGKHQFVAFVPDDFRQVDVPKSQGSGDECGSAEETSGATTGSRGRQRAGFVLKLRNGSIELAPGKLDPCLLSQAALHNTKVTVVVSEPVENGRLVLEALVVPAEPAVPAE